MGVQQDRLGGRGHRMEAGLVGNNCVRPNLIFAKRKGNLNINVLKTGYSSE